MTTKFFSLHIVDDSLSLSLDTMTSNDKDELIGKLFNEVARLQRVLDAVMTERDQLAEALDSRQTDSRDSQGKTHEQTLDRDQSPLEFEETLVSDDTLRRRSGSLSESDSSDTFPPTSDSDSSSVLFPRQCGTPLSAPPNVFSFPDDGDEVVFLSSKRERRLSLPADFEETEEYYSVNDEDELRSESCFGIVDDARYEDYVEQVEEYAEEEVLWDDDSEEEINMRWLVSNRTHFLNDVQFEMPATRTGMEKYSRRIFHPCLPDIPETGECLITFPVSGLDFVDVKSKEIVIEEIPRCTSSLGFSSSASTKKKSWFDMTLEDEEDPFW